MKKRKLRMYIGKDRVGYIKVGVMDNSDFKRCNFITRKQAQDFIQYCYQIYKLGRMDEFKDNVANAQKLMEKFGL